MTLKLASAYSLGVGLSAGPWCRNSAQSPSCYPMPWHDMNPGGSPRFIYEHRQGSYARSCPSVTMVGDGGRKTRSGWPIHHLLKDRSLPWQHDGENMLEKECSLWNIIPPFTHESSEKAPWTPPQQLLSGMANLAYNLGIASRTVELLKHYPWPRPSPKM